MSHFIKINARTGIKNPDRPMYLNTYHIQEVAEYEIQGFKATCIYINGSDANYVTDASVEEVMSLITG